MRNRFYSSSLGRFFSEDPIGLGGGDVSFYRYVGNDPVSWVDPWGLRFSSGVAIAGSTINPFTSSQGSVHGYNNQNAADYTYSGNGIGLDVGASIESVWAWGDGPWSGDFSSVNASFAIFTGSFFWSPDEGGWIGFTFGLSFGLPGIAYEETLYNNCP